MQGPLKIGGFFCFNATRETTTASRQVDRGQDMKSKAREDLTTLVSEAAMGWRERKEDHPWTIDGIRGS